MYGSVEQPVVGRDEPKNGCEGGYSAGSAVKEVISYFFAFSLKWIVWATIN